MKNKGSTPILTNPVGVHPRNIHREFEANLCSGSIAAVREKKSKMGYYIYDIWFYIVILHVTYYLKARTASKNYYKSYNFTHRTGPGSDLWKPLIW